MGRWEVEEQGLRRGRGKREREGEKNRGGAEMERTWRTHTHSTAMYALYLDFICVVRLKGGKDV